MLARQLPSEHQDDGNSGGRREGASSPLSHSLTGRVPADLRSQTLQIVGALVISRSTAPQRTPL
jgi:hypothetical protein